MSDFDRLWKTLDGMAEKLSGIEIKLTEVVRLEERVNSHDHSFTRYGRRLDSHESRIRDAEMWQANHNNDPVQVKVHGLRKDLDTVTGKVRTLEGKTNVNQGSKDIIKEMVKWTAAIVAAYIIFRITGS